MRLLSILLAFSLSIPARTEDLSGPPPCRLPQSTTGLPDSYDLSPLSDVRVMQLKTATPPTETIHRVRMALCGGPAEGIALEDGYDKEDQCPSNTQVCLQIQNHSPRLEPALRTLSVVPIAGEQIPGIELPESPKWESVDVDCEMGGTPKKGKGAKGCQGIKLTARGGRWSGIDQQLEVELLCPPPKSSLDGTDEAEIVSYTPFKGVLRIRWIHPDACPKTLDEDGAGGGGGGGSEGRGEGGGGGHGFFWWIFLLTFLVGVGYLGLGIWHNRTTYDAHGWDLIPHKEFWHDFPMLVRDLFAHLLGGLRGGGGGGSGGGRGGYEAIDG